MEFFKNNSAVVVPQWLKFAVVGLLSLLVVIYCISTYVGITRGLERPWFEAGADILHVLIPLLLVVLVAAYAESGVSALQDRAGAFLTDVIPDRLIGLVEPDAPFRSPSRARQRRQDRAPQVMVQTTRGHFIANYIVRTPIGNHADRPAGQAYRRVLFRIELNARHLNFNLCIDGASATGADEDIAARFKHTLEGAKNGGYWFNSTPIRRDVDGKEYVCLVGSRALQEDFLINSIAKLDVAQDLALMLRAFINEYPAGFELWETP